MCFGAVGDAIGDAFQAVDKGANAINPFKGITDWGTANTLAKIPGVGKPIGQLADWGDSHPAEVGAMIGGGYAAAGYLGAGAAATGAGDGTAMGGAAGTLGATDSATVETGAAGADAGAGASGADASTASGFGGVGTDPAVTGPGAAAPTIPNWVGTAAKVVAPAVISSLLAPKPPKTKAPTAMPDPLAEQQATQQKLIAQMARRGRSSTILTNPSNAGGSLGG